MRAMTHAALLLAVLLAGVPRSPAAAQLPQAVGGAAPLLLDGEAAIVTIFVRPDHAAAFDQVIARLKAALPRSQNAARRAQASGWQIFKAQERVQGNVSYLMRIDPVVSGQDYDIPRLLADELPGEAAALSRAYRAAHVAQSAMGLTRVSVPGLGVGDGAELAPAVPAAAVPVLSFDAIDAAVLTVLVKPDLAGDFEAAFAHVGKALQASRTPGRKRQAAGWKLFKGTQGFGGNVPYVISLDPVLSRVEYDPMRLIQETFPADVDAVFARYRAAYVGQAIARLTNRVSLSHTEEKK